MGGELYLESQHLHSNLCFAPTNPISSISELASSPPHCTSVSLHRILIWLELVAKGLYQSSVHRTDQFHSFTRSIFSVLIPAKHRANMAFVVRAAWMRREDSSINAQPPLGCSTCLLALEALALPGNLWKTQMFLPETYWVRSSNLCFNQPSTWPVVGWSLRTTTLSWSQENINFKLEKYYF